MAKASLELLLDEHGRAFTGMGARGDTLAAGLREALRDAGIEAVVQNVGPMVQAFMLNDEAVAAGVERIGDFRDYCRFCDRERFRRFALEMIDRGVYLSPSAALHSIVSTQTTDEDIEFAIATARDAAQALATTI